MTVACTAPQRNFGSTSGSSGSGGAGGATSSAGPTSSAGTGGMASSCADGKQDGNESDVDCGGSCAPCAYGRKCFVNTDCASTYCVSSVCDAFTLTSGPGNVHAMAVDATHVYWALDNGIESDPKTGNQENPIVNGQVNGFAVTATTAYYGVSGSGIKSVPTPGGGAVTTFLTEMATQTADFGIAVDSKYLYATSACNGCGVVIRAPLAGGPVVTLASNLVVAYAITVDLTNVYFTTVGTAGAIMKVSITGGPLVTLVPNVNIAPSYANLAVDSTSVYYITGGGIFSVPIGGGSPTTVVPPSTGAETVTVGSAFIYYNAGPGLYRINKTGGMPETVASPPGNAKATALVVDNMYAYWATSDGVVRQIAK
jgi:hypothetical protein